MMQRRTLIILYAFNENLSTTEKNSKWVEFPKESNTKVRRDKVGESGIARVGQSPPARSSKIRGQAKRDYGEVTEIK